MDRVRVKTMIRVARKLRESSTNTERYLWQHIKIGRYIIDFVNLENKMIIELDGVQHMNNAKDIIPHPCPARG